MLLNSLRIVQDVSLAHKNLLSKMLLQLTFNDLFAHFFRLACQRFARHKLSFNALHFLCWNVGFRNILWTHRCNLHSNFVRQRLKVVKSSHEVGFAVYLNDNADSTRVNITFDQTFTSFAVTLLFSFRQAFFAHSFQSFIEIALSFNQSFFSVSQAYAGQFAQFFDIVNRNAHPISPLF